MTQANNVAIESSQINSSGVLQVAGGGTGTTTSTGTGALVLNTSPTLTTPLINQINTSVTNTSLGAGNASIMKNRIINGAMVIDQRNAGASVTPASGASTYLVDRWRMYASQASKLTAQQNANSITPPVGFTNYEGITSSSAYSITSTDIFTFNQPIEGFNIADLGWGTVNAKTVTLSFQVYSSLTGTFGGSIKNSASTQSYPFSYSIPVANTWTTISVTITGSTTGTWATNNTTGLIVFFGLGVGSTYSGTAGVWSSSELYSATGATSVVGTSGATFYITGVQLEVGSSATGFEYRQYQQELALCQRYYWKNLYASGNPISFMVGAAGYSSTTIGQAYCKLPVTMRAQPTSSISGVISGYNGAILTSTGIATTNSSVDNGVLNFSFGSGISIGSTYSVISTTVGSYIDFSAEL